jgi:Protein of unknown function (DUF1579)
MSTLDKLAACAGSWRGTNHLQDPQSNLDDESPSTAAITPLLSGKFVRFDYTWAYKGKVQEGSLVLGLDAEVVSTHWIDSWHMGTKAMNCSGTIDGDGRISVKGSYAAPPGPDWGWRIDIIPTEKSLQVTMFNIWPEGKEDLAVQAQYQRNN